MKRRPPASVACALEFRSVGNAKAHFSLRLGTFAAVRPGLDWKRLLEGFWPQPLHCAPDVILKTPPVPAWHIAEAVGAMFRGSENFLPLANSAIARRCSGVWRMVTETIAPDSSAASTRAAVMPRSASRLGARSMLPLWQPAQMSLKRAAPSW